MGIISISAMPMINIKQKIYVILGIINIKNISSNLKNYKKHNFISIIYILF